MKRTLLMITNYRQISGFELVMHDLFQSANQPSRNQNRFGYEPSAGIYCVVCTVAEFLIDYPITTVELMIDSQLRFPIFTNKIYWHSWFSLHQGVLIEIFQIRTIQENTLVDMMKYLILRSIPYMYKYCKMYKLLIIFFS